jgi:threonine aldolase
MIDLRTDTVTHPTEEMRDAMRRAELGDDGRDGDPTVRRLEDMAAAAMGQEAGVMVPSGTMSNLVALLTHASRDGGEVLLDADSHIMRSELGGIARLAGLFPRVYPAERGAPDVAALRDLIQTKMTKLHFTTSLICLETTHNDAGGAVLPLDGIAAVRKAADETGTPLHIDGARVFNAAVALGVPASEIGKRADSIGFCVSKGLSAPVGSVLCGSKAFVERARVYRRMVGGTMRQAGVFAAAGIVALEKMVERLADDHRRARVLADGLHAIDPKLVNPNRVDTNIVMVQVGSTAMSADAWISALAGKGIKAATWSATSLRLVTHRHIDDAAVEQTVAAFRELALNPSP